MSGIGLISNPKSQGNRRGLSAIERAAEEAGIEHRILSDMADLRPALEDLAAKGVELLVVNGGDGTLQAALTAVLEDRPFDRRPLLAVLPRGMTNMSAADIGLVLEAVPDADLQDHVMALAKRMAQVPTTQLVMLKLLCNQTVENMGLSSSRTLGTLFDGIARHTQEGLDFVARAGEVGYREAVRERDDPFGDYGSRRR